MKDKECFEKLPEEYSASPPIEIPLDCIKKKTDPKPVIKDGIDPEPVAKDEIPENEFIVGSYNPKKNFGSLIKNIKEPGSSSLLGDQSESVTDSEDGLFFGDLEL